MQPSGSNELCTSSKVSAGCCRAAAAKQRRAPCRPWRPAADAQVAAADAQINGGRPAAGQLLSYGGLKGHAGVDVSSGRRATMAAGWYLALERRRSAGILVYWVDPWVNVVMGQAKPKSRNNFDE